MWGCYLIPILGLAVLCDLYQRKIPNTLIIAGLIVGGAYQWCLHGTVGLLTFVKGSLLPFLLLAPLHYFRMLGAGDIKLLMVTGGFLGAGQILKCMFFAFLAAAAISLCKLFRHPLLWRRFDYLAKYLGEHFQGRQWQPYILEEKNRAYLYFSIPVMISVLLMQGGII